MHYSINHNALPHEYHDGVFCDVLDGRLKLEDYLWTNQLREVQEACDCLAYVHGLVNDPPRTRWNFIDNAEKGYIDFSQYVPKVFVPYVEHCVKVVCSFEVDMYQMKKVKCAWDD